jgi:hypothetical protein
MTWLRAESGDLINADHIVLISVDPLPDARGGPYGLFATLKIDAAEGDHAVVLAEGPREACEAVRDALAECLSEGTFTP